VYTNKLACISVSSITYALIAPLFSQKISNAQGESERGKIFLTDKPESFDNIAHSIQCSRSMSSSDSLSRGRRFNVPSTFRFPNRSVSLLTLFIRSRKWPTESHGARSVTIRDPRWPAWSLSSELSSFGATCRASVSDRPASRGAKPRLRQRTRSISQTAGVFVCPRDVTVRESSRDDEERSLPRVAEVAWAALAASRRREHGHRVSPSFWRSARSLRHPRTFHAEVIRRRARVRWNAHRRGSRFRWAASKRRPRARKWQLRVVCSDPWRTSRDVMVTLPRGSP